MNFIKKNRVRTMLVLLITMLVWTGSMMGASAARRKPSAPARVQKVKVSVSGTTHKVTWKRIPGVSGYQVYCRDYSSGSKLYKKVKNVNPKYNGLAIKNRKRGKAYSYVVRAYKKNSAGVSYGKLSNSVYGYSKKTSSTTNKKPSTGSSSSSSASGILKNPTTAQKYKKVFGNSSLSMRYPGGYYKSSSQAAKNMKSITVKTWDFKNGRSGPKYTRTFTIKVHKNLASTVQQIFKEIYNNSQKFPIHELGGYAWRGGHSEHNTGTAIDINWTENYMVNIATGAITAGKYWKPGIDPYSIPKDGIVANTFKKYGFSQGDWGNSKDYMHFSYFGT